MHQCRTRFILFFGICLAGCSAQPAPPPSNQAATPPQSSQATTAPTGSANQQAVSAKSAEPNPQPKATPEGLEGWVTVTDLNGRLSAKMPSPPKVEANEKLGVKIHSQKVLTPGIVWNVLVNTYSQKAVDLDKDPMVSLERICQIYEKLKPGAKRVYLKQIEGAKYPTVEHRFEYEFAKNAKTGEPIAWFSIHHHVFVGTSVCTLFIDAQDAIYKSDSAKYDKQIDGFFESLQIRDE